MPKVGVCICSFERPDGLRRLLKALDEQRLSTLSRDDLQIVIVDNSLSRSAKPVFLEYSKMGKFLSTFVHEKNKGLANARNAAIECALALKVAFFAFIDDDEIPLPGWIEDLLSQAAKTGAAAVIGPVYPVFEEPPPEWALGSGFYSKVLPSRNGLVEDGHSANCLVSCASVDGLKLRFDPGFNETGGEDTWFFKQLRSAGGKLAWSETAIVMEFISTQRMTQGWLLKRWYRTGSTEAALCAFRPSSFKGRLVNLFKGLIRIAGGTLRIVVAVMLRPFRHSGTILAPCYTLCRGAGLLMSVMGKVYKEYSASDYR